MKITVDIKDWAANGRVRPIRNPRFPRAELQRLRLGISECDMLEEAKKVMGFTAAEVAAHKRWQKKCERATRNQSFSNWSIEDRLSHDGSWYRDTQNGRRNVRLQEVLAIACFLGMDLNSFIADMDTNVPKAPPVTKKQVRRFAPPQPTAGPDARRQEFRVVNGGKDNG